MRIGFLISAFSIVVLASLTPIALVKAQQSRNQGQPQGGLSEKNKKSLSRFGPEDVFEVSGDDPRNRGAASSSRQQQRRGAPTPTPSSAVSSRRPVTSATVQPPVTQPSVTPNQSAEVTPSPTAAAAAGITGGSPQSPISDQGDSTSKIDSRWAAPILIMMALVVSAALIFTLSKLVEKIREGSSG